jgi:hypothetical protein
VVRLRGMRKCMRKCGAYCTHHHLVMLVVIHSQVKGCLHVHKGYMHVQLSSIPPQVVGYYPAITPASGQLLHLDLVAHRERLAGVASLPSPEHQAPLVLSYSSWALTQRILQVILQPPPSSVLCLQSNGTAAAIPSP